MKRYVRLLLNLLHGHQGTRLMITQKHNVFMMLSDPAIQKATGKSSAVDVMSQLREMKNNS